MSNNGTDSTIDDDWSMLKNSVLTAVKEFIPTKHVKPRRSPPWITPNILHFIHEKGITRNRYLSRGTDYLKQKFSRLRTQVKKAIKEREESFYHSLGSTLRINPKRFWSNFKIKSNSGGEPNSVSESVIKILKVDHMLTRHTVLHRCLTSTFIRYTPALRRFTFNSTCFMFPVVKYFVH